METLAHASLHSELDALHATRERLEAVFINFLERVCTSYSGLMRSHAVNYRYQLNALFSHAKSRGTYARRHHVSVCEDVYSLSYDETTREKERAGHLSTSTRGGGDIMEVVVPPSNPLPAPS